MTDDATLAELVEQDTYWNDGVGMYVRVNFDGKHLSVYTGDPETDRETLKVWVVQ